MTSRDAFLLGILTLGACSTPATPTPETGAQQAVPLGKADNYYSTVAAEFEVRGSIVVDMTPAQFEDDLERGRLVSQRLTAVGLYLTTFVSDKIHGIDINGDGEISDDEVFWHNVGYGGFHAMVRNYSVETGDVLAGEDGYRVEFSIDMAGPRELLTLIPDAEPGPDGYRFDLLMPEGASVDPQNVPRWVGRHFDPADHDGELETVSLTAKSHPDISNAYPHFAAFTADGVLDITLLYGHDYNDARWDLIDARRGWDELLALGFDAPVEAFEDLDPDSGPFVLEASAGDQPVTIEVRLFHSDMYIGARQRQHDDALGELVARDVFFYNGHAGPYFGFYLDAAGEAEVRDWEFAEAPFDPDRQQLVVAQGCQTYSQYADMLYANPAKDEHNLDVITTVNFSYAQGTTELLRNLVRVDEDGQHVAPDVHRLVSDLNANQVNRDYDVFYGIMGVDGNPQLHPYADLAMVGEACELDSDCGDPRGNVCAVVEREPVCGAVALTADACPEGTAYYGLVTDDVIDRFACLGQPSGWSSFPDAVVSTPAPYEANSRIEIPAYLPEGATKMRLRSDRPFELADGGDYFAVWTWSFETNNWELADWWQYGDGPTLTDEFPGRYHILQFISDGQGEANGLSVHVEYAVD